MAKEEGNIIDAKAVALAWAYSLTLSGGDVNNQHIDLRDIFELLGLEFPFDDKCRCLDAEALEEMGAKSPTDLKNDLEKHNAQQRLHESRHQRGYDAGARHPGWERRWPHHPA